MCSLYLIGQILRRRRRVFLKAISFNWLARSLARSRSVGRQRPRPSVPAAAEELSLKMNVTDEVHVSDVTAANASEADSGSGEAQMRNLERIVSITGTVV